MTLYTGYVTIAIPLAKKAIPKATPDKWADVDQDIQNVTLGRCCSMIFDPDSGGFSAFISIAKTTGKPIEQPDGSTKPNPSASSTYWAVYGSPCHPETADGLIAYTKNPAALHSYLTEGYDRKGLIHTKPDKLYLSSFCAKVLISKAYGINAGLAELGLVLEPEAPNP